MDVVIDIVQICHSGGLRQKALTFNSLRLVDFSDLSFASLVDDWTQLGFTVLLEQKTQQVNCSC